MPGDSIGVVGGPQGSTTRRGRGKETERCFSLSNNYLDDVFILKDLLSLGKN